MKDAIAATFLGLLAILWLCVAMIASALPLAFAFVIAIMVVRSCT